MQITDYIFIVGVSRSGTSLMRRIFNRSSQAALCDENFYMGHLIESEGMRYKFRRFGDLSDDQNVKRLTDFIYSPAFKQYSRLKKLTWQWRWFVTEVSPEVMLERLLACDRSERAVFDVFLSLFAEAQNAVVKGEKTPAHIRYIDELLEWFPNGKIVHMMRDPRAIFTSELRRRKEFPVTTIYKLLRRVDILLKLFLMVQVTITWRDSVKRYRRNIEMYNDRYLLVRFEDLVSCPQESTRELCNKLGLEFQEQMLEQRVISDGFQSGKTGFDTNASKRWLKHIPGWVNRWFSFWFRNDLAKFGY